MHEALADAQTRIVNLEVALESNRDIGVAIGILMSQRGTTAEGAAALLRKASQNRKVRDLAEDAIRTGGL